MILKPFILFFLCDPERLAGEIEILRVIHTDLLGVAIDLGVRSCIIRVTTLNVNFRLDEALRGNQLLHVSRVFYAYFIGTTEIKDKSAIFHSDLKQIRIDAGTV